MLTQERLKELLDYNPETGVFTWKIDSSSRTKKGSIAGVKNNSGYIVIRIAGEQWRAHRLAWLYVHGCWPIDQIDHINRVKDDNRLCNLREATNQENQWNTNKRNTNTSGYTGVHWNKTVNKWQASIKGCGKRKHLGLFDTPEDAHTAYLQAKAEYHNF